MYIPQIMAETILAAISDNTSLHISLNYMCRKQNLLINMEQGYLKVKERRKAITEFALLNVPA
jgi:hypothetical protein